MRMKRLPSEANCGRVTDPAAAGLGETCKPMDKNRIEGRYGTTSWHNTAKSSGLPVEVNAAVVQGNIVQLPGEIPPRKCGGKSAEVIVAENKPGVTDPLKLETGNLECVKDRTDEEPITAWRTLTPLKPVDQEVGESRHDGKNVGFWGEVARAGRSKSPPPGRRELQP